MEDIEPVKLLDGSIEQFIIKNKEKSFKCECGCNVFHKPDKNNLNIYECNSCGAWYG